MEYLRRCTPFLFASVLIACGGVEEQQIKEMPITATPSEAGPIGDVNNPDPYLRCRIDGDCCPINQVHFNGKCRRLTFFERFLSQNGELGGVAGPVQKDVDSGVVVVETLAKNILQKLFIEPEKLAPGAPAALNKQYRASYPVVAIHSFESWQDGEGFLNELTVMQRSTGSPSGLRFGVSHWVIKTHTPSGYTTRDSNGATGHVIASGGSGNNFCDVAGDGADLAGSVLCGGSIRV